MGHGGGHCQNQTEAVEHGYLNHQTIGGGKIHAVANGFSVVDDVVVGQHHPFGESGGAGGVLHVAYIVLIQHGGAAINGIHRGVFRIIQGFLPGQAAILGRFDGDNVSQERQFAQVQGLAFFRRFQLGAQCMEDAYIVGIFISVDHNQGMGVRLSKQVFCFVNFVCRINRHQNGANLHGCPEGDVPFGYVGRPDGYMISLFDAQRNQGSGKGVHLIPEFGIGAGIIQGGIFEGDLVGEFIHHAIQKLGEGQVNQLFFRPNIIAGFADIVL